MNTHGILLDFCSGVHLFIPRTAMTSLIRLVNVITPLVYVCIICMVISYSKSKIRINRVGLVANPARGQLNREN